MGEKRELPVPELRILSASILMQHELSLKQDTAVA